MADEEKLPQWTEYGEYTEDIFEAYQKYVPTIFTGAHGKLSIGDAIDWNDKNPAKKINKGSVEIATRWDPVFTVAGMGTSGLKAWNSGNRIAEAWTTPDLSLGNKLLDTCQEGAYALEGVSSFAENALKLLKCKNVSDFFGKIAPWFKVSGGSALAGRSLADVFTKEQKPLEKIGSGCDFFAGTLDVFGGICELTPATAALAIPLGLMASTASIAGAFFSNGDLFGGIAALLIGGLITAVVSHFIKAALKTAFKALIELIRTAFNLSASPLAANPFTAVAGLAIIILISTLIGQAISNLLGFAQGGFPALNHTFIAREAGPELVGTIRGRNAVVNNDQIVEAVSRGVYGAFMSAIGNKNSSGTSATARVYLDGKRIAMAGAV